MYAITANCRQIACRTRPRAGAGREGCAACCVHSAGYDKAEDCTLEIKLGKNFTWQMFTNLLLLL